MRTPTFITGLVLSSAVTVGLIAGSATAQAYKVGSCCAPFGLIDEDSGEAKGYSVEVMKTIAEDAGLDIEFEVFEGIDGLVPALRGGDVDILAGPTVISDALRERGVAFTEPYARFAIVLIVSADENVDYTSVDDLAGKVVSTPPAGTIAHGYLQERGELLGDILPVGSRQGLEMVRSGEVAAYFGPDFSLRYRQSLGELTDLEIVESFEPMRAGGRGIELGLAMRREDAEVLESIDASLARLVEDGTIAELAARWGVTPP